MLYSIGRLFSLDYAHYVQNKQIEKEEEQKIVRSTYEVRHKTEDDQI
jgi:hypothetical protein